MNFTLARMHINTFLSPITVEEYKYRYSVSSNIETREIQKIICVAFTDIEMR